MAEKWIRNKQQAIIYAVNNVPKLCEYGETEQRLKLTDIILKWRIMVGVNESVTKTETDMNIKWIMEEYSQMSPEKIDEAIKMSLKGGLFGEDNKPLDIKPYGKFSPMYISMVLNAYVDYERKELWSVMEAKREYEMASQRRKEALESRRNYIQYYLSKVNTNCTEERFIKFNYIIYNFLLHNKLIEPYSWLIDVDLADLDTYYPNHKDEVENKFLPPMSYKKEDTIKIHKHLTEWFKENQITYENIPDEQILYDFR